MITNKIFFYKFFFIKLKFNTIFYENYKFDIKIFFKIPIIIKINLLIIIKKFKSNLNMYNSIFYNFKKKQFKRYFHINNISFYYFNYNFIMSKNFNVFYIFKKNKNQICCNFNFFKNSINFYKNYNFYYYLKKIMLGSHLNINKYSQKNIFINFFLKYYLNLCDYLTGKVLFFNNSFISNKYLINYLNLFNLNNMKFENKNKSFYNYSFYNNYYPLLFDKTNKRDFFLKKFKYNFNINHILYTNKLVLAFLEKFTNRKIYIKINNNYNNSFNNYYLNAMLLDYKNYQPSFFKNFLVVDFIKILWYSFFLKDLKMLSNWITNLMESIIFKYHKKFLSFFNNFINKFSGLFIDVLKIKGFFFDIRGKVGVTGSSKKRHFCFKFGSIQKSSKKSKMCFNQNLIRTYSGVMGVTYIINF